MVIMGLMDHTEEYFFLCTKRIYLCVAPITAYQKNSIQPEKVVTEALMLCKIPVVPLPELVVDHESSAVCAHP